MIMKEQNNITIKHLKTKTMKTPKEKAIKLVEQMAVYHWTDVCDWEGAKQCAIIAVNEIIKITRSYAGKDYDYYLEVKQEIIKL